MDGVGGLGLAARVAMAAVPGRRKRKGPAVSDRYRQLHRKGLVDGDGTGLDEDELEDGPDWNLASDPGAPPDPGGYLEQYHFGLAPDHWHSYHGQDLYGAAADRKYNQYASDPVPVGGDPYPNGDMGEPGNGWEPGR